MNPFILVKFLKDNVALEKGEDPVVSLLVFEWHDKNLLGKPHDSPYMEVGPVRTFKETADARQRQYICNEDTISAGFCTANQTGEFILADNAEADSKSLIRTEAIHLTQPNAVNYPVRKTGYYCVETFATEGQEYTAVVEFRNAYGELPAAQIAKLPFYGGMAIVYAVIGIFWGFLYVQHRHDILAVQNYITAIIIFLVVEMLMTWGFYDYQNRHGNNVGSKVLMIIVSILNAGRNSFSFFLLLIVCMGYGVVKPSLGKTMIYVRWLAVGHFIFGVIYAIASLTIRPDDAGPLVLLVILPLSATLTAFYIWTLNSLNLTMKDLADRKQNVKALMYKKLWWCILASILVIFGFFFFNSFAFAGASDPDFAPTHWQTRWFVLDGWLNLVYMVDVCFVAYMWRPTANNRRFAMSDEVKKRTPHTSPKLTHSADCARRRRLRNRLAQGVSGRGRHWAGCPSRLRSRAAINAAWRREPLRVASAGAQAATTVVADAREPRRRHHLRRRRRRQVVRRRARLAQRRGGGPIGPRRRAAEANGRRRQEGLM